MTKMCNLMDLQTQIIHNIHLITHSSDRSGSVAYQIVLSSKILTCNWVYFIIMKLLSEGSEHFLHHWYFGNIVQQLCGEIERLQSLEENVCCMSSLSQLKHTQVLVILLPGGRLACHARELCSIQLMAIYVRIYGTVPVRGGSECSRSLHESWEQRQRMWTRLFLLETQWPVMRLDTSQRPTAHFQAIAVANTHVHTVWGGKLTVPFVFHKFYWLQLFTPSTAPPPTSQTCTLKHTLPRAMWDRLFIRQRPAAHLVTDRDGGVGSSRGSKERGGGSGRGGTRERAHRAVLQGLLNLHIPVHLAPGRVQECPLM